MAVGKNECGASHLNTMPDHRSSSPLRHRLPGRLLTRMVHFSYDHAWAIAGASALFFFLALFALRGLRIDTDFARLLDKNDRHWADMLINKERFGESSPVIIALTSNSPQPVLLEELKKRLVARLTVFDDVTLNSVGNPLDIADETFAVIQLRSVLRNQNPSTIDALRSRLTRSEMERLLRSTRRKIVAMDDPGFRDLLALDALQVFPLMEPFFLRRVAPALRPVLFEDVSQPNSNLALIVLHPQGSAEDSQYCRDLILRLDQACRETMEDVPQAQDVNLSLAGLHVMTAQSTEKLEHEMVMLSVCATGALLLLLLLTLRHIAATIIVFAPLLVSMTAVFLLARVLFNPIYFITIGFVAIVLGLGLDISLHLAAHYFATSDPSAGRRMNAEETVLTCAWPLTIGTFSTALAFAALLFTHKRALIQFALLTSLGLLASLVITLLLFPCLVRLLGSRRTTPNGSGEIRNFSRGFFSLCVRHANWAFAIGVVLLISCLPLARTFQFDTNLVNFFPRHLEALESTHALEKSLDTSLSSTVQITIEAPDLESAMTIQRRLDHKLEQYVEDGHVACFESPSAFIPYDRPTGVDPHATDPKDIETAFFELLNKTRIKRLAQHQTYIRVLARASATTDVMDHVSTPGIKRWVDVSSDRVRLQTLVWPGLNWTSGALFSPQPSQMLDRDLKAWSLPDQAKITVMGTAHILAFIQDILKHEFYRISGIALLIILGFVGLCFRRIRPTILSFVPLMGAIPAMLATIVLLGLPFTPTGIAFIAIVLGVGIDDAVHLITRCLQAKGNATARIVEAMGPVLTLTTASTAIGFGCLTLSSHPIISSLGKAIACGVLACWLFSFLLLPFLLKWVSGGSKQLALLAGIITLLGFTIPSRAQDEALEHLLNKLENKLTNHEAISCDFSSEKWISQLEGPLRIEGTLWFQKPNLFRIECSGDEKLLILNDGQTISLVDMDFDEVERFDLDTSPHGFSMSYLPLAMDADTESLRETYAMEARDPDSPSPVLILQPKDPGDSLIKIEIEFGRGLRVKQVNVHYKNGDRVQTRFRAWRKRERQPIDAFRWVGDNSAAESQ